jgi:hypothetical protein
MARPSQDSSAAVHPAPPVTAPTIAVSATFTAELIEAPLAFWIDELGFDFHVKFAPYNQVFQQLLDPESLLARNRDGFDVVLVRFEDWSRFGDSGARDLEVNVRHLISSVCSAAGRFRSPLLVSVCPASPGFLSDPARAALAARMEHEVPSAQRVHPLGVLPDHPASELVYPFVGAREVHGVRRVRLQRPEAAYSCQLMKFGDVLRPVCAEMRAPRVS